MEKKPENKSSSFMFYSNHNTPKPPKEPDYVSFIHTNFKNLTYPCILLIRNNGWNDFGNITHFEAIYLTNKDEYNSLGEVIIIQSEAKDYKTNLPTQFSSLTKTEFFSRGTPYFYTNINKIKEKNIILSGLNDFYYHNYTLEHIYKTSDTLSDPCTNSLFRNNFYELDISSEYAKNSLDVLDKIKNCLNSLSKLDKIDQEILLKLLYGSVIVALESYLSDAFKHQVNTNKTYFISFLKHYKSSDGEKKYTLKELGLHGDKITEYIEDQVKKIMNDIIFHKIIVVKELYEQILNIKLPPSLIEFQAAIQKRHDIFHRNGKSIAGNDLNIQPEDVILLITQVKKFIKDTEAIILTQI